MYSEMLENNTRLALIFSLPAVNFMPPFVPWNHCCDSLSFKCIFESLFKPYGRNLVYWDIPYFQNTVRNRFSDIKKNTDLLLMQGKSIQKKADVMFERMLTAQ